MTASSVVIAHSSEDETLRSRIEKLAESLDRNARAEGMNETAIPSLHLFRSSAPTGWAPALYEPALVLVVRGGKELQIGGEIWRYDPAHYVLASVDLPLLCRVVTAPCLVLRLRIDPLDVGELLAGGTETPADRTSLRGLAVTPVEPPLLDAVVRLVSLLDAPADIPALAPLVRREIVYRVLTGPRGARLRQAAASGAPAERVADAISWIRGHMADPLRVEEVARKAGMGLSAFHVHFKTVTGLSPIQYQKRLRLMEARRTMVAGLTAAEAASHVGYASPSQFSRDYRRTFGAPPRKDVEAIRGEPADPVV